MKKIVIIDQADFIGGAEYLTSDLLHAIEQNKYEIHLITGNNPNYISLFQDINITIHNLQIPRLKPITPITFAKYISTTKKLKKLLTDITPDIVITNTVRSAIITSPITKKLSLPLVWIFPDDTFPSLFLKKLIHIPTKILPCSKFIKEWIINKTDKKYADKIEPLYNGIDMTKLQNYKKEEKKIKTIGMVGRIVPWKGQMEFLKAAAQIIKERDDVEIKVIGQVHKDATSRIYYEKLDDFCNKEGIQGKVNFIGSVKDIYTEIVNMDILIHASTHPEPLGRVVIEGMALKTPVIAADRGGPKEIIDDGKNGFLVDPKNTPLLKEKMIQLLDDETLANTFRENALKKVEEKFNLAKVAKQYENTIDTITNNHG